MSNLIIQTDNLKTEFTFKPNQTIINCLVKALVAALPAALDAFFNCLATDPPSDDQYRPGHRPRCE